MIDPLSERKWRLYFESQNRKRRMEVERLKAINADLLEALEDVRKSGSNIDLPAIEAAIKKAKGGK